MHQDIVIIGAGPAGLAFARSLADTGLRIALVDRQSREELAEPPVDGRDIALTHQSRRILEQLGAWQLLPSDGVSRLHEARVIDGDASDVLNFGGSGNAEPLGWLVANHLIRKALFDVVKRLDKVELISEASATEVSSGDLLARVMLSDGRELTASLFIGADTRFSETRRSMGIPAEMNDFGRVAIVCRMEHEKSHKNIAWECFHYGRTLAILPMPGNASSIVITVPASAAPGILAMDEDTFNADIEERFESRLGRMRLVGDRHAYPLVAVHAKQFVGQRFALIGDAAVGMHPVTAHGFNLGLSGAELLARQVSKAVQKQADIGAPDVLLPYQAKHRLDTLPLFLGTNTVVGLFTDDSLPAKFLRKAVLHASNHLPPVKWAIRRKLTGQAGFSALPSPPGWLLSRLSGFKAG